MASIEIKKYKEPEGFRNIIVEFTKQVLKKKPRNMLQFATKYFEALESAQIAQASKNAPIEEESAENADSSAPAQVTAATTEEVKPQQPA